MLSEEKPDEARRYITAPASTRGGTPTPGAKGGFTPASAPSSYNQVFQAGGLLFLAGVMSACTASGSEIGHERGPCAPDGTCGPGLVCLSAVCVRLADAGAVGPGDAGADGPDRPSLDGGPLSDSSAVLDAYLDTDSGSARDADGPDSSVDDAGSDVGPACGNGVREPDEACDGSDFGSANCESLTGSGVGLTGGSLGCTAECAFVTSECHTCGNAVRESIEECDASDLGGATCVSEGFTAGSVACSSDCTLDTTSCTTCGDGSLDGAEQCDGSELGAGSCAGLGYDGGRLTCTGVCAYDTSGCHVCGDRLRNGLEQCDDNDLAGSSCTSLGFQGGVLSCSAACGFDTSRCYACGDGARNGTEQCDGFDLGGASCLTRGYAGGDLGCSPRCAYDTSGCFRCGNARREGLEECDGGDFGLSTCATTGFDGGSLSCRANCTLNSAACFRCGDGIRNGAESCDGGDFGTATCLSAGFAGGNLRCSAECATEYTACVTAEGAVGPADVVDVYVYSANDAWATTIWGDIYRYDGAVWNRQATGTGLSFPAVHGSDPSDVWFGGIPAGRRLWHFDGTTLRADVSTSIGITDIWVDASIGVVTVGGASVAPWWGVYRNTSPVPDSLTESFRSVSGDRSGTIFAGSGSGRVLRYSGGVWQTVTFTVAGSAGWGPVWAVWGRGPADFWAAMNGVIYHYGPTDVSLQPRASFTGVDMYLESDGTAATVWFIYEQGIVRYNGSEYVNYPLPGRSLTDVSVVDDRVGWLVDSGRLVRVTLPAP